MLYSSKVSNLAFKSICAPFAMSLNIGDDRRLTSQYSQPKKWLILRLLARALITILNIVCVGGGRRPPTQVLTRVLVNIVMSPAL